MKERVSPKRLNGYEVLEAHQTEGDYATRAGWVVLVDRGEDHHDRFVTAWCADDEDSWYQGHYYESKTRALRDFYQRCERGF